MNSTFKTKKAKIAKFVGKVTDKACLAVGTVATSVMAMGISSFAESGTSSSASLSTALSGIDTALVLDGFYQVLPLGLTIALPIVAAKVGLNFFFGMVKGA